MPLIVLVSVVKLFAALNLVLLVSQLPKYANASGATEVDQDGTQSACETLYLLNVRPHLNNSMSSGSFDIGLELSLAGHLAAEHINNQANILNGYKLKLLDIDSEPCGANIVTHGLVNMYRELLYSNISQCIVGVVGLYCSTVTRVIDSLAGHPNFDYVQLSASTSPNLRGTTVFPNLYYSVGSSSVFNRAVVALMDAFNWTRISLVFNHASFYSSTTASDFEHRIERLGLKLILHLPVSGVDILTKFNSEGARISFWSISAGIQQAVNHLCEASRRNFTAPGYIYIFHETQLEDILRKQTTCTRAEMLQAVEGIYLLLYKLSSEPNETLVSGLTYNQYQQEYKRELQNLANKLQENLTNSVWANSLYDQVWAMGLALNSSLSYLDPFSMTYGIGNISNLTDLIANELQKVSFRGASGVIQFNSEHDVNTSIEIWQVRNGVSVLIGIFNPDNGNISFIETPGDVSSDRFDYLYNLLPQPLGIVVFVVQGALCVLITLNLILLVCWRKKPEVKAMSPYLSGVMFFGCYMLCAVPVLQFAYKIVHIEDSLVFTTLCNLEYWLLMIGINLIFSTLFLRLLRVFHVFRTFKKTGKLWSDKCLFLYIILICSVQVCVLIIWTGTDHLQRSSEDPVYFPFSNPPHYEITEFCTSENFSVWVALSFIYTGLIVAMVIFLAIQTRHIQKRNFKDTKKVNVFVAMVVTILIIGLSLTFVLSSVSVGLQLIASIIEWLTYLSIPLFCQLLLFVPKTFPLCYKSKDHETMRVQEHTITATIISRYSGSLYRSYSQRQPVN